MYPGCSLKRFRNEICSGDQGLLLRLSQSMVNSRIRKDVAGDNNNPRIPAGYTYLGQFIAHDMAFSQPLRFVDAIMEGTQPASGNPATARLDLSTLYGDGPEVSPHLYSRDPATNHSWKLRLVPMKSFFPETWAQSQEGEPLDVARICPLAGETTKTALMADPRNDGHLLINQLTVLFARYHNRVAETIEAHEFAQAGDSSRFSVAADLFNKCRRIVLATYHKIIIEDYLRRLLDNDVGAEIHRLANVLGSTDLSLGESDITRSGFSAPAAFSSAAFRVGHAMARSKYSLSNHRTSDQKAERPDHFGEASLIEIIELTSRGRRGTPLKDDWAIEWDRFFFESEWDKLVCETNDGRKLNYSNPIEPTAPSALGNKSEIFQTHGKVNGGVVFRDLMRGLTDGLDDADVYVNSNLPGCVAADSCSKSARHGLLEHYFKADLCSPDAETLSHKDICCLAKKTPLFLYILLEAVETNDGCNLGPVGSRIVGSTIANALVASCPDAKRGLIEWPAYFSKPMPSSMPELLKFLQH